MQGVSIFHGGVIFLSQGYRTVVRADTLITRLFLVARNYEKFYSHVRYVQFVCMRLCVYIDRILTLSLSFSNECVPTGARDKATRNNEFGNRARAPEAAGAHFQPELEFFFLTEVYDIFARKFLTLNIAVISAPRIQVLFSPFCRGISRVFSSLRLQRWPSRFLYLYVTQKCANPVGRD